MIIFTPLLTGCIGTNEIEGVWVSEEYKNSYDRVFETSGKETQKPKPKLVIETKPQPPQQIPQQIQPESSKEIKTELVRKLAMGEISQEVYLIAIKSLEEEKANTLNYYG